MTHEIKITEVFADAVISGRKTFEIRKNDRGYNVGDLIHFHVVDDYGLSVRHDLNFFLYQISYVLSGWGLQPDYVVFGIQRVEEAKK